VYAGSASRAYGLARDVGKLSNATAAGVVYYPYSGLQTGVSYYFAVTAYTTSGLESLYSNEKLVAFNSATPPRADAGPDQFGQVTDVLTLGSGPDPGVNYVWIQTAGPSATLSTQTGSRTDFSGTTAGTYAFTLIAYDVQGLAAQDSVTVALAGLSPSPAPTTPVVPSATATTQSFTPPPTASATATYTGGADRGDGVTPTRTPANSALPSATPTRTFAPGATATYTGGADRGDGVTPTRTPTNSALPSPTPTATVTYTGGADLADGVTPTRTPTNTALPSATPTRTFAPGATATYTGGADPGDGVTPSRTPTDSALPSATPTATATYTGGADPADGVTPTRTPTNTALPSATPSRTLTLGATSTLASATLTPTVGVSTETPTVAPTETSTPTPTLVPPTPPPVSGAFHVSGSIGYYSNQSPVSDATVEVMGLEVKGSDSDPSGQFAVTNLEAGVWHVQPQKQRDEGVAITSMDATYVLQAATGLRTLSNEQRIACDVTGDGQVDLRDAQQILRWTSNRLRGFAVADLCGSDWAFEPVPDRASNQQDNEPTVKDGICRPGSISYDPLMGSAENQSFLAILYGDCTGNWQPTGSGATVTLAEPDSQGSPARVRVGRVRRGRNGRLWLPVYVAATEPVYALDMQLHYRSASLKPVSVRSIPANGDVVSEVYENEPGTARVAVASKAALRKRGGAALAVSFDAGRMQSASPHIDVEWISMNEGLPVSPDGTPAALERTAIW
jgi:hypothetical protein